jgi:hypothetical protein
MKMTIEITTAECDVILSAYDLGINALTDEEKQTLYDVVVTMKRQIWP